MNARAPSDKRCPRCGVGVVVDISYDVNEAEAEPRQEGDSRQITRYSCGHEVIGPELETSDADRLDVERRRSEETT